ncbi:MAG: glycosyltransferase family 2 protein [Candidatus Bathyarchaeia archaeon]
MSSKPLVSVIILNFNGKGFLETCLSSVLDSDYPEFEVIFIDNGSTDGSVEFVERRFGDDPRLRIVRKSRNVGVTRGLNSGIGLSKGEYTALLNNDTKVHQGWLKELVAVLESDRSVGAAQCKLLSFDYPDKIDSAGCVMDAHGCVMERGRVSFDFREEDRGQYDQVEEIFSAGCPASLVRRSVLKQVGLFDPEFFAGYEDADLSWRIRLGGYRIVLVPKAVVYHKRGLTSSQGALSHDVMWHFSKNRMAMLIKNYSLKKLTRVIPPVLAIYLLQFTNFLRFGAIAALIPLRALFWNVKELRYLLRQRHLVQRKIRRVPDSVILKAMKRGCITVQYYLQPYLFGSLR